MKLLLGCIVLLLSASTWAQRASPPSLSQVEHGADQEERNIPPPVVARPHVDVQKLRADAEELSKLAQSIPLSVDQTTKGILPKDLSEKLKRIEKLAKQLRGEISR